MSVLKNLRNLSDMEFYKVSKEIRNQIIKWSLYNFGAKYKLKDIKVFLKNINDEDKEEINKILEKYKTDKAFSLTIPDWLFDKGREKLHDICYSMTDNIIHANEIYVTSEEEYQLRRCFQDKAIADCYQLYTELEIMSDNIPMNLNTLIGIFELIDREITLLRGWKGSDKKAWNKKGVISLKRQSKTFLVCRAYV